MAKQLKEFVQRWIITTVAVLAAAYLLPSIQYDNWQALLAATLVLGLLNAFIKPVLVLVSIPLLILTLGFFYLIINALLLFFVGNLIQGFHVGSFGTAFVGSIIISIVTMLLNIFTSTGNVRVETHRSKPRPPPRPPEDGGGPIIDV